MKKYLIVGLGNIGHKYVNTRHNIGFDILDALASKEKVIFETLKLGDLARFNFKGRTFVMLKPSTYMNLSGKAVNYWMQKEKVSSSHLLIVCDDINLTLGTIRLKAKGSDGGHNGLKDIQEVLQTTKYPRLRFGVGADFSKGKQVDYVLGNWSAEDNTLLAENIDKACESIKSFGTAGLANTMNVFNNK
ncbi:MAG: aminoacyl-tRNA hydrolase [Flavobacteriaceae bacterium]|nr:aminoacyl-tRNA hydrolase [Flavobacteriaceae bacterium]